MKNIFNFIFILNLTSIAHAKTEHTYENPKVGISNSVNAYLAPTANWYNAFKLCELFNHTEFVSIRTGVVTLGADEVLASLNEVMGGLIVSQDYKAGDKATVITLLTCR